MNKKDLSLAKKSLALHKKLRGKIRVHSAAGIKTREDLSLLYTPGVGAVSLHAVKGLKEAQAVAMNGRMVAVISDGSAVLGLGNIGPLGALPVMEGKAAIFKEFADVDAFPIVLATQDVERIVDTICAIAPGFAGINLEDFSAPRCFEIEEKLKQKLSIPVMHDDQHGTAIVVLAGLINATKVVNKRLNALRVVVAGAGAAGTAIAKILLLAGVHDIIVLDRKGALIRTRSDLSQYKLELAKKTNPRMVHGSMEHALVGSDVFIGVSGPGILTVEGARLMAPQAIMFALANPVPEIMPDKALKAGAAVVATGRSDFPNQINNALVFPGIFRGALDHRVVQITDTHKLHAARNLAALIKSPTVQKIIPDVFDARVVPAIARAFRI